MTALPGSPRLPVPRFRAPVAVAIALAWLIALAAQASGYGERLHHDGVLEGGLPVWAALGLFAAAWQVMIAAMMLPSSLPLIALFERATAAREDRATARVAFLGGYAVVWTAFGLAALAGDAALHTAVHASAWLTSHEYLIAGGVFLVAGGFQFSSLKYRCLHECRHPGAFLMRHYRRGTAAAFRLGAGHGVFCLGCCWALMLVAFAAGATNLVWMALLAALMAYEKAGTHGESLAKASGVGMLTIGALTLVAGVSPL